MAWTADKVKQLRQSSPGQTAKKDEEDGKWTAERVRQVRTTTPASSARTTQKAKTAAANPSAAGNSQLEKAYENYRTGNNLGLAEELDKRSDVLNQQKVSTSLQSKLNAADQLEKATEEVNRRQALRKSGAWTDTYTIVNNWKDSSERNRKLADLVTATKTPEKVSAADLPAGADYLTADTGGLVNQTDLTANRYTDADLKKMGYTQTEIDRARNYLKDYSNLNPLEVAARRLEGTAEGTKENLKGGTAMYAGALTQAVTSSPEEQMIRRIQSGRYTDEQLEQAGYDPELIRTAHQRIASGKTLDMADDDSNRLKGLYEKGRETHKAGERLMADATAGESAPAKFLHGAAASASENLALMILNPWSVLPVLSAQGAGDSMAASDEKGESPEKAVLKASLKFGAGWAINSVGAADLAKTMGSDYAKDTLAGSIADWVRGLAGDSAFAQAYPAIANAVSGGIDNAMQAFVETYADQAVDAALGDSDAAKTLFSKDTFLQALESGLSGGMAGAMGGAVGTGLNALAYPAAAGTESETSQSAQSADSSYGAAADGGPNPSAASGGSSPFRGANASAGEAEAETVNRGAAFEAARQALKDPGAAESAAFAEPENVIAEQTAVNDDPAGHTPAQNASIEEYKNSVDPKLKKYVDRVRAGEQLEPYVVAQTSDRMRSAMMELTGLEKVGDRTLMDANAVQHITNRHAGGNGSADATMKDSADMARAAYVLNNFDNAYLAKDRADGYMTSNGKRAPIVIFEKKIDGSHVVVEAACDTKKNTNYIISEYLAKNGVDTTEVTKGLRSPVSAASDPGVHVRNVVADPSATAEELQPSMDAASSPRDTSETLADLPSADTSIAPEGASVNGQAVENTGEKVESSYADAEVKVDPEQLDGTAWNRDEQKQTARQLADNARMTTKAAQGVVDAMPEGIGAGIYAQAANSLYQLGKMEDVKSFDQAVSLTGPASTTGGAVRQVLALGEAGENALRIAYTYGKGEAEAYNARKASEIGSGKGALNPDAGTYFKGRKVSGGTDAMDAFIELSAKSSGAAIHRAVEGLKNNAKGLIRAAAGEMYLSGEAGSETVMHETFHLLNEWSPETGQAVMDRMLTYLVQQNGMENTEKLVESYLDRYAKSGVKMTWNQALEEITADAMETVFGTEDGFRNFVRQQAMEAKMNSEARGVIGKVMNRIDELLHNVLADVKRFLKKEPTNAAAKAAKSLTEKQLQDLQSLYFEHQMEAGEKYREALEAKQESEGKAAPAEEAKEEQEAGDKYQLDVDSEDVEAAETEGLGDVEEQNEIVGKVMDLAGKVAVSDTGLKNIARAVLSDCDSRMDTKTLTERLRALSDYIRLNPQVDWAEANAFVMDMADQIMQKSAKRNDELWKAYPELHRMGMTIEKGSKDYQEIRYRWGSWANAKKELARHGVDIRQSKEGEHSRWDADFTELQKLGAGLLPDETPSSAADALAAMAVAHDAIRPVMENSYDENWEEAQQDLAMQIWQRYMESPEIASEKNAPLRKAFAEKRQEVRDIAKQQAAEAKAKAEIARLQAEQMEKDALVRPYLKMTQQAIERQERAEHFAKMQRLSVAATVQQAKDRADKRVEKARNAREMDNTRRVVRNLTSQLTQMTDKPSEKAYVPEYLLDKVRPVVMLANDAIGNHEAARKLAEGMGGVYGPIPAGTNIRDAMEGLGKSIEQEMKHNGDRVSVEWQQSGVQDEIDNWLADVNENRQIEMEKLRGEIDNANRWLTEETPEKKAYLARLNADLKAYQDGNMATLTMDQLTGLRDILEKTMYIVKNENVMLGSMEDVMIDDFAEGVSGELKETGAKQGDSRVQKVLREIGSVYRLNTMNIERNFERMGGYRHGGYMEQLGQMLNDGQFRKERITAEGERIFANVTGPEHADQLHHFTHDLVDIGLKTKDGKPWLVTHDVMTELWVQLQNKQGMHHLLHGGATIADMSFSTKGMAGLGEQFSETVTLGELATTDEQGNKLNAYEISQREDTLRSSILGEIEKNLTPYDEQWIRDFRELGKMTKQYINETSMILYHTKRARVDNYIRLHVDRNTLVEQNEGVRADRSVGSEGFMKTRQTSSKPLELVGLVRQASESIENTAQFAGMAVPLRNAEKVLNSMQDGKTLYGQIERVWGRAGRNYMTKAMADLTGAKSGSEVFDRLSGALRGAAAAAVLTGNLNVTLLQAASLPTAAAELGWNGAGQSAIQFVKNISGKQRRAIEERAYRFGDALLPTRMRGSQRGELSKAAKEQGVLGTLHDTARNSENKALRTGVRVVDAVADVAAGSIGWMDEVTVASLFYGSEQYVQKNLDEYGLTKADLPTKEQEDGTKAYQNAVMEKFQRVVERTQPNYTTMQRTGMQRTKNQLAKTLMMFSTQRQQNAQIMVSAIEDLAAQQQRYRADRSAENKAELEKAGKRMADAVSSQIVQTAVIAGLGLAVKFALHRWDDLQDENGDMTFWSLANNFIYQFFNSGVSNYTGGSEAWTAAETILSGKSFGSYDSISMTGFSAVNDVVKTMAKLNGLLSKDTDGMDEEDFAEYEQSVRLAWADTAGQLMMLVGVPYNNGKKYVQAVFGWMDTIHQWGETGKRNFNSLPSSATGQYDRLYNAIQSGDSSEAQAALEKLEAMGKGDQIDAQLKRRLKEYDEDVRQAAEYQNAGKDKEAQAERQKVFDRIREACGVREAKAPGETAEDKARRTEIIDLVTGAVNDKAEELYKGGKDGSVYDDLKEAVKAGRKKDVQEEIDRLRRAGRAGDNDSSIKSAITAAVKDEYVGGNDHDRAKLEELLLSLQKADGTALYEEKTLTGWVTSAEKKAQADKDTVDEWAAVR